MTWSDKQATIAGAVHTTDKYLSGKYLIEWHTVPPEPGTAYRPVLNDWLVVWPVTTRRIFGWTTERPTLVREA